jgi:hypothetical protein
MPIYHVAYDGAEANVHAANRPSAVAQLKWCVDNDITFGQSWGVEFTFDHLPADEAYIAYA